MKWIRGRSTAGLRVELAREWGRKNGSSSPLPPSLPPSLCCSSVALPLTARIPFGSMIGLRAFYRAVFPVELEVGRQMLRGK